MAHARIVGLLTALGLTLSLVACDDRSSREITIGAASSLRPLLDEVVPLFERETGITAEVSYGASGAIARQIEQGAPIDVFASADTTQIDELIRGRFLVLDSIFTWGYGQLVAVRPVDGDPSVITLADADRIAIANPETAPYGAAAKQLMEQANVWDQLKGNIVFAETALQALLFAQAGEVDFAFVPLSLLRADSSGVTVVDQAIRVNGFDRPVTGFTSLDQSLALVAGSDVLHEAREFVKFFASDEVVRVFESLGYTTAPELNCCTSAR